MALTVEDGTGLSTADSYISEADADAYVTSYEPEGYATWNAALSAAKEVALRKATQYLDTTYVDRWKGSRINTTMSLDWPRQNVYVEGAFLAVDAVPVRLEQACVEIAIRFLSGDLVTDIAAGSGGVVMEKKKLGPMEKEIEYAGAKSSHKRLPKVDALLGVLIGPGNHLPLG